MSIRLNGTACYLVLLILLFLENNVVYYIKRTVSVLKPLPPHVRCMNETKSGKYKHDLVSLLVVDVTGSAVVPPAKWWE